MNNQMNDYQEQEDGLKIVSFEIQIAMAIQALGYAPQLAMKGCDPVPKSDMPWATISSARITKLEGVNPTRIEAQMEFQLIQNAITNSNGQKMAVATELMKDVVDVINEVKKAPGVAQLHGVTIAQAEYKSKPSEQIAITAKFTIVSNY